MNSPQPRFFLERALQVSLKQTQFTALGADFGGGQDFAGLLQLGQFLDTPGLMVVPGEQE